LDVAALKLGPGVALCGAFGAGLLFARQFHRALYDNIVKSIHFKENLKTMYQPVIIAKFAATPILGGFIAKQIVPWVKGQLGIEGSGTAVAQPINPNPAIGPIA
jgi:hypothetical protein